MNDMSRTIIPKSDQLNADDLLIGPITITITGVVIRGGQEQPVAISYEGDNGKPYKACKSMCRVMVSVWGADASKYVGKSMTLFCDPKVRWAGMEVGGIRISHMSDIDSAVTMALTATKGNKKPFIVKPLKIESASPPTTTPSTPVLTPATGGAGETDPTDASLVTDIEGQVKRKKFDFAYDLARGIKDPALRENTEKRIANAKQFVDAKEST